MPVEQNKYLKQPVTYKILGLEVQPKPLKLRWLILSQPLLLRMRYVVKRESGLTDADLSDPRYAGFIDIYELYFFSHEFDLNPELEASKAAELQVLIDSPENSGLEPVEKEKRLADIEIKYKHFPTGPENLAELLSFMVTSVDGKEIDWKKFIDENEQGYNEIRDKGVAIYKDFFTEFLLLKQTLLN